jgi:outer membrane protein TolC
VRYEIDLWGRVRRSITAAREQAQASDADLENVRLSLHAEGRSITSKSAAPIPKKELLDDTVKAYSKALELTKNRFEGGVAPNADVAQAETQQLTLTEGQRA